MTNKSKLIGGLAAGGAALLTGRNHHSSHMGRFNDDKFGTPGYDTYLPMENGTMAEILRENGYATLCIGKYNAIPVVDGSNAGPFNRWPTGRGFDHYYGFNPASGSCDQWHPLIYRDTHREPEDPLGRPAVIRLADEAINYIADHKGKTSVISLFIDDVPAGSIELPIKQNIAPKSNAIHVGRAWGVSVNDDYSAPFYFSGRLFKASIDVER